MRIIPSARILLAIALTTTLTACGTVQNYNAAVTSWKNASANQLYTVWGYPNTIKKLPNGNQLLTYVTVDRVKSPTVISQNEEKTHAVITGGDVTVYRCTTWFEVNRQQTIVNATFKGNNCLATKAFLNQHLNQ